MRRLRIDDVLNIHDSTCSAARAIIEEKNHDYTSGSSDPFANFRASKAIGVDPIVGICVRIIDKLQRLRTFAEQGKLKVKNESAADAVSDIINYAVLAKGLIVEQQEPEPYESCPHQKLPEDCLECLADVRETTRNGDGDGFAEILNNIKGMKCDSIAT